MIGRPVLTRARLAEILSYDPETGVWTRVAVARNGKGRVGERAGTVNRLGYRQIAVDGVIYAEHRLAFLWMGGEFPPDDVDHINRNRADNRWANLRPATRSQNLANTGRFSTNTSGLKGVSWSKSREKWVAQSMSGNRTRNLGLFDCPAAAHFAYLIAADKAFGAFARAA